MLQNACTSSSLIFSTVLNCYRMERNFVISHILSVNYEGINFLPISISARPEKELLQNTLNIKLYQADAHRSGTATCTAMFNTETNSPLSYPVVRWVPTVISRGTAAREWC
jgi:hypothetical protein